MKNESLVTCPTCQTPNFTPRGLKAHRCKGVKRTLSALENDPNAPDEKYIQRELARTPIHSESFTTALAQASTPQLIRASAKADCPQARFSKIRAEIDQRSNLSAAPGDSSDPKSGITIAPGQVSNDPTALADMSVPQLAEAGKALDRAGDLHENTAGICRLLHGLVLMEAKRKLAHGKFIPWVKTHFSNSYRDAARRMQAAADFLAVISDKKQAKKLKCAMPVTFEAQRLLLGDLATNLTEISAAQLDMSNPVVQAAAAYVGKRSWTQLVLDLGDPRENNGGKRTRLNGTKRPTKAEHEYDKALEEAMDWYELGVVDLQECYLHSDERWSVLPEVELANVADLVKLWAKKLDDICRSRKVVPSKLSDWDKNLEAGK